MNLNLNLLSKILLVLSSSLVLGCQGGVTTSQDDAGSNQGQGPIPTPTPVSTTTTLPPVTTTTIPVTTTTMPPVTTTTTLPAPVTTTTTMPVTTTTTMPVTTTTTLPPTTTTTTTMPPRSCLLNGVTVAHGQSFAFARTSMVACGQTCERQSRICNNGVLSGSDQYASAACTVAACPNTNLYKVGPARSYTTLNQLFNAVNVEPGDVIEVDGGVTYAGGIIVPSADGGSVAQPVIIRGMKVSGQRPILSGGVNTIEFRQSNHVVLEGFEITGGTSRCVFQGAHNVTIRDAIIRDCPRHGILSADNYSGSFTLEFSELRNCGEGTQHHTLYIQSDQIAFPESVFTMRFNYVHSGIGGNLLKSRHEKNRIYYNWFEGSLYHEVELIGPDFYTQQNGWTVDTKREDSDVVGNVIVHKSAHGAIIRVGGDVNENSSKGRTRFVNNTIYLASGSASVFRIFEQIQSVEAHNNVFSSASAGSSLRIERTVEAVWTNGVQLHGSNNSVKSGATNIPTNWSSTQSHANAGFTSATNFTPINGSVLINSGTSNPVSTNPYPFIDAQALPLYYPPMRMKMDPGTEVPRNIIGGAIDIGAIEAR